MFNFESPVVNFPIRQQVYGKKKALISFEQLAACFALYFNKGEGKCWFGFNISPRYDLGSKQSLKK